MLDLYSGIWKDKILLQDYIIQNLHNFRRNAWTLIKLIGIFNQSIYFSINSKEYLLIKEMKIFSKELTNVMKKKL